MPSVSCIGHGDPEPRRRHAGSERPVADVDTLATIILVVLAAGVGWFLWRRK
jgi:hypothetical protein